SVTQGANGTVTNNGTDVTYTPNADYNGVDSFDYTVSDGQGGFDTATVTVTVTPVNDAPVAVDDAYSTNEDTPLTVAAPGVLANDSDVDGDPLTAVLVTGPGSGTLTLNSDGSFNYTPNTNFNGTDSFVYEASDGNGGTDTATVTITVNAVNYAPVAADDAYVTDENTPLTVVAPGVLSNDTDTENDPLTSVLDTDVSNGTLVLNADGSFTYTPDADFNGTDSFTYTADDGNGGTDTATVTITVNPVNDAPVANDDSATTDENVAITVNVLANDTDVDGDTLSVASVIQPTNGTVVINADNTVTYTPTASFNGLDSFTYIVSDGNGGTDTATVTIDVTPVGGAPIVNIDIYPNRAPNYVFLSRNYTIYVAVMGSAQFDVTDIDSSSVLFGRTGTEASSVRAPILRDLNGDGFLDAMYGFQTFDCGFQLGDTEGWLTGLTVDGTSFVSSDSVLVLP
ncbi:MAG: tandem-95 repeat protein, partial [Planctomycetes bacterium]|nr:tandem-95 repeat protein [Planctomycetota bacterium]